MKLSFVFNQLASGELSSLSCVDSSKNIVKPEKYQHVVNLINLGLVDLHTRFKLKIGEVRVPIEADTEVYRLDRIDPLCKTRFLQVHNVTDNCGRELGVNDFGNVRSVHFTSKTEMHVPQYLRKEDRISEILVKYRAMPKQLNTCGDQIDPDCMDVDLDYPFVWALCLFVASRANITVGLQDGTYAANAFVGLYNAECTRLEEDNFELSYQKQFQDIRRDGWA